MVRLCAVLALSMVAVLGLVEDARVVAQTTKAKAKKTIPPTPPRPMVNELGSTLLVRTLLVAFHHAAVTGNYSVLRDLGTPQFRVANTPVNLAEAMKNLRGKNFRLDIASLATPVLLMSPHYDKQGRLRLYGYMPTRPEQVLFDLRYLYINKRWLIQGLRINIAKVPPKIAQAVAKRANTMQQKARVQASKSPKESAPSTVNSKPGTSAAPSHPDVNGDALAAFGQHLRSKGVLSTEASSPEPPRAKR